LHVEFATNSRPEHKSIKPGRLSPVRVSTDMFPT
jgi:hypothetical protein